MNAYFTSDEERGARQQPVTPDAPITTKRDRDEWKGVQMKSARMRAMPAMPAAASEGVA
jgi:hypothetical protein